jgi:putative ABC transport system permease protein
MSKQDLAPSRLFTSVFKRFCNTELYFELQGDLLEEFYMNSRVKGVKTAQRIYRREVLKMLRPSVIKKIKTQRSFNNTAMFKNYTKVAFRSLVRNKLFSTINIAGLAISMAVGLLAITFVNEIGSYDEFHENKAQIYRVFNNRTNVGRGSQTYATTSLLTGYQLMEQSSAFERIVPIFNGFNGSIKKGENLYSIKGQLVGEDFLNMFTFPLLYGNSKTALKEPYSVVLTEATALKIFSKKDVVGEIIERGKDQYIITGVMIDPPSTSHIKFDALASLSTYKNKEERARYFNDWGVMWSSYVYVQLKDGVSLAQAQESLNLIAEQENAKVRQYQIEPGLEALTSIFPGDGKYNQMSTVMPKENINQVVILALIVLFSACFNYANLSIARSLKRAKEVGIRKVVGAKKWQLYTQFVAEAVIISILSLFIAFFLFRLIRPEFLTLNFYTSRTTTLELTAQTYLYFAGFAVIIGIIAGTLPAILMCKIKTINVLKGVLKMKSSKGINIRKVMIGLQFTLSMGFAIMVTLAQKQYSHALNFDLGYQTDNIVNVYLNGLDPSLIKTAYEKIPDVAGISTSYFLHSTGTLNSDRAKNIAGTDSAATYNNYIDTDYLNNMNHELLAGENFKEDSPENEIIVNEKLIKRFGFGTPSEAIGEQIDFYGKHRTIIGIVKDFHYGTIYNVLQPFAFLKDKTKEMYYMNIKVNSTDMVGTLGSLEEAWDEIYPKNKFEASFYDDDIERTYNDLSSAMKTFSMLAIVAISISILGLLGMAVFTAESRVKELTIRKVLGASLKNLVGLLSKSFMIIFIFSAAVAIPLTYYLFKNLILVNLEYAEKIGFWELTSGAVLIMAIAFLTIGSQTLKAAKSNPAENLRNE